MPSSASSVTPKIFDLIHSLTPSEITYFKKSAKRNAAQKPTYMTAFETILAMNNYDEKKLIKRLRIKTSNLRVVNAQLYNRIIDKLHEFHIENSIEEKVKKNLHLIKILLEKNLSNHISRILDRTRNAIIKYELFEQLPDLLKIEQQIWDRSWYEGTSEDDIRALHDKMVKGLEQQKNLSLYLMYRCIVKKANFDGKGLSREDIADIEAPCNQTSFRTQIEYYHIMATHHFTNKAVEKAYECNQKLLRIYEENPALIELSPNDYIVTLNHYLVDSFNLNKYTELEEGMERLERLLEQEPFKKVVSLQSKVFVMLYRLKFNRIIVDEKFEQGLELIEKFEPLFKNYKSEISITPQIELCYMVAYILFVNKQYKKSLIWLNDITQKKLDTVEEICLFARSLELVTYYELGHKYLDNLIGNAQNHIKNIREKLYKSERQLFALLRELHKTPRAEAERKDVFEKHLPAIIALRQKSEEARFYGHFDLLRWIESKLEN